MNEQEKNASRERYLKVLRDMNEAVEAVKSGKMTLEQALEQEKATRNNGKA